MQRHSPSEPTGLERMGNGGAVSLAAGDNPAANPACRTPV
jgi:hypothetical protein